VYLANEMRRKKLIPVWGINKWENKLKIDQNRNLSCYKNSRKDEVEV